MHVEELEPGDLDRIREIDRSETARFVYVREGDELRRVEANLELPTWSDDDLAGMKARLAPKLAAGGVLLGALDGDRLAGAAVLAGDEVAFLHVSRADRGRGVGRLLLDELRRRATGPKVVVSASDTESAIRFYLAYGFRPAAEDDPRLRAENEPTDIQLTLELSPGGC